MNRVDSLDYLRGLLAVAVMGYHYTAWSAGSLGADSILGRLGVYAVSTFYILSGLSLGLVYKNRMRSTLDVAAFAIKRAFRIAPLFWLTITLALFLNYLQRADGGVGVPLSEILLNYTLLFGFVVPHGYFSVGAWSIGNEVVFYAIFPVVMLATYWRPAAFVCALGISILVALFYAFVWIDPSSSLRTEWRSYVTPLNQLYLFIAGIAISRFPEICATWSKARLLLLLGVALLVFCFWPASGDRVRLVTGFTRVVLSAACLSVVFAIYRLNPHVRGTLADLLSFCGRGCYSIYLLHPIVWSFALLTLPNVSRVWVGIGSAALTLIISAVSFKSIERPMMDIGGRLARAVRNREQPIPRQPVPGAS